MMGSMYLDIDPSLLRESLVLIHEYSFGHGSPSLLEVILNGFVCVKTRDTSASANRLEYERLDLEEVVKQRVLILEALQRQKGHLSMEGSRQRSSDR